MARIARWVAVGVPHDETGARQPAAALAEEVSDWRRFLAAEEDEEDLALLRRHGRTGRPWGDPRFLARLEKLSRAASGPADRGNADEKLGVPGNPDGCERTERLRAIGQEGAEGSAYR